MCGHLTGAVATPLVGVMSLPRSNTTTYQTNNMIQLREALNERNFEMPTQNSVHQENNNPPLKNYSTPKYQFTSNSSSDDGVKSNVHSSINEPSLMSQLAAELNFNFALDAKNKAIKEAREMQQSNGKPLAPRPGVHIPVSFSDVGPIPPPRMFSDSSHQQSLLQAMSNIHSANDENVCDRCDSPMPSAFNCNQKSTIPVCIIKNDCDGDDNPIHEEEVPAKEPQMSAVPLKSALKKPRIGINNTSAMNHNKPYSSSPTPSNSSFTVSHNKPQAPAPPNQPPYSQASSVKPQVSPRFQYSYGGPVQLLPVSVPSPLVGVHRPQVT